MTALIDKLPPRLRRAARHPAFLCVLVALILKLIGDAWPLSHFPMYSSISDSADILFVTNEKDEPLPMSRLFNVGSAQSKKRFETYLKKVAQTRKYEEATEEQRRRAGEELLENLWAGRDEGDVADYAPRVLRLKMRTVSMRGNEFQDRSTLLAERLVDLPEEKRP